MATVSGDPSKACPTGVAGGRQFTAVTVTEAIAASLQWPGRPPSPQQDSSCLSFSIFDDDTADATFSCVRKHPQPLLAPSYLPTSPACTPLVSPASPLPSIIAVIVIAVLVLIRPLALDGGGDPDRQVRTRLLLLLCTPPPAWPTRINKHMSAPSLPPSLVIHPPTL